MPIDPTTVRATVLIVAYNHERFIEEAVESALAQNCDFAFDLLIADDGSTDGTRRILERYRGDPRVRFLFPEQRLGDYGNRLFIAALRECRGEYMAWLDGDDYWTDTAKLQTMVGYLDQHPELSGAFHAVLRVTTRDEAVMRLSPPDVKSVYRFEDLIWSNVVPSSATVYRMADFPKLDQYASILCLDWVLHLLQARRGGIGYIDRVMASYRIHEQGVWSRLPVIRQREEILAFIERLPQLFNYDTPKYRSRLAREWANLALAEKSLRRHDEAHMAARKALRIRRWSITNLLTIAAAFTLPAPLLRVSRRVAGGVRRRIRRLRLAPV